MPELIAKPSRPVHRYHNDLGMKRLNGVAINVSLGVGEVVALQGQLVSQTRQADISCPFCCNHPGQ
jgi:hypothetical protein